jgi:hypothetical protein
MSLKWLSVEDAKENLHKIGFKNTRESVNKLKNKLSNLLLLVHLRKLNKALKERE